MGLGLALLAAGFITMMFGDKANYGEDFVGITLGPLLLLAGFGVEFAAIMVRDKSLAAAAGGAGYDVGPDGRTGGHRGCAGSSRSRPPRLPTSASKQCSEWVSVSSQSISRSPLTAHCYLFTAH